jgi:hypothetical protein
MGRLDSRFRFVLAQVNVQDKVYNRHMASPSVPASYKVDSQIAERRHTVAVLRKAERRWKGSSVEKNGINRPHEAGGRFELHWLEATCKPRT